MEDIFSNVDILMYRWYEICIEYLNTLMLLMTTSSRIHRSKRWNTRTSSWTCNTVIMFKIQFVLDIWHNVQVPVYLEKLHYIVTIMCIIFSIIYMMIHMHKIITVEYRIMTQVLKNGIWDYSDGGVADCSVSVCVVSINCNNENFCSRNHSIFLVKRSFCWVVF